MSHLRSSLLAFLVLGVVVSGFDDISIEDCEEVTPGSERPELSPLEKQIKSWKDFKDKWFAVKSDNTDITKPLNFVAAINSFPEVQTTQLIPPGMKWCGDGDRAKHENDLGHFNDTDACCQKHDLCEFNINAGKILLNLNNDGMFTRSACYCDDEFHRCLKKVNSIPSNLIGRLYFNRLSSQCFMCSCPTNECTQGSKTQCMESCDKYKWRKCHTF